MEASQWHKENQAVLMAAIETVRLRLLEEPDAAAAEAWRQAEAALNGRSKLHTLVESFELTDFEKQVIVLCAGLELDPRLVVATGKHAPSYPTFQTLLHKLPNSHWSATAPDSPLRFWQLITLEDSSRFLHSRLQLDERILHFLMGVPTLPQMLTGLLAQIPLPKTLTPSHTDTADQMVRLHQTCRSGRVPVMILKGKDSRSNRDVAAYAYRQLNLRTFAMQAGDLPTSTHERLQLLRLVERETVLNPAALFIDAHALSETLLAQVRIFASQFNGLLTIGTDQPLTGITKAIVELKLSRPSTDEQIGLWKQALGSLAAPFNGNMTRLARQFNLEAGGIQLLGTRLQSELSPDIQDPALIEDRLRDLHSAQIQPQLDALCHRIKSRAEWDDLVLPDKQHRILQEIVMHVQRRFQVYYDWGFAHKNNRGLGISALFSGESGTGKTLAAEIISNHLRLPLYRIELSAVVSKYIGETEKNLARIFDGAEEMGSVLLFDEADALFGKRSEVKDAHDRYANIEVSYLLQRMEAYHGLAILTTNFKRNLDSAFIRRLRFIVQFPFPGPEERAKIWQRIFPANTPLDTMDYQKFAQLNVAGGNIKNIALSAAFHAANIGEPVNIQHILQAAHGEYAKLEKPLTSGEVRTWVK